MPASRARSGQIPVILLVEELESLRTLLQSNLEDAGLFVLLAKSCEEALRLARTCGRSIDLLLTHMHLQGISGPELALLLRAHQPGIATLYMSENLTEMMEVSDATGFISSLLPRPFSRKILLRRVSMLLAAHFPRSMQR